jgi:hypothetical protein
LSPPPPPNFQFNLTTKNFSKSILLFYLAVSFFLFCKLAGKEF